MGKKRHNPERRSWRGRSHKRGGKRIRAIRQEATIITSGIKDEAGVY